MKQKTLLIVFALALPASAGHYGSIDPDTETAAGNVAGRSIMQAFGSREGMGITATGEDIWPGTATSIPEPADVGEQMTIVSTDNADNGATATGVLTARIEYLDASGDEQTEDITLNGTTPVSTTATDIRFVNDLYSLTVGSNGVAEGTITLYKAGAAATVYNMIALGGNKSLVPNRMVPNGKTLILKGWHASEAQAKRVNVRIRSTDMRGTLIDGVFCFKDATYINQTATGVMTLNTKVPALSIVKISGWPDVVGADVGCGWWGILIDD